MNDPEVSLIARGLYALLLAEHGKAIDPYADALDNEADILIAVQELLAAGLAVRVTRNL